jgi:hypothetical protein
MVAAPDAVQNAIADALGSRLAPSCRGRQIACSTSSMRATGGRALAPSNPLSTRADKICGCTAWALLATRLVDEHRTC